MPNAPMAAGRRVGAEGAPPPVAHPASNATEEAVTARRVNMVGSPETNASFAVRAPPAEGHAACF